jgi:Mrp family chromosome partitioning ATPase
MGDYFGFAYEPGLAEVLAGSKDVSGVLRTWREQVDIVFAGRGRTDPGHLIASSRLLTVFDELKKDHDLILVDAPASTAPSDVSYIVSFADAAVLLAKQGASRIDRVKELAASLRLGGCSLLGSVFVESAAGPRRLWPIPRPRLPRRLRAGTPGAVRGQGSESAPADVPERRSDADGDDEAHVSEIGRSDAESWPESYGADDAAPRAQAGKPPS